MKHAQALVKLRISAWFVLLSMLIGLSVALVPGNLRFQFAQGVRANAPLEDFRERMDERVPALMKAHGIPGASIALVQAGEVVWTEAYGYADVASGQRLTVDTPMSVQSISKPVTAWGVMRLAEQGMIDLDTLVSRYLFSWQFPSSAYPVEQVTVRQLLSHTAGMPLGDFNDAYAPGEALPALRDTLQRAAVLEQAPGTRFAYSNVGFNLLELLIEDVAGRSFSDYMCEEVFEPLQMRSATYDVDTAMTPYPPTGYNLAGQAVPVYLYPEKGSGGLFATAKDIARFAAAGMKDNPVLSAKGIERMYAPERRDLGIYGLVFDAYGLGHYLETLPGGARSISHGGQGNGLMTHLQAVPETGDAIVILTGSQRSWPFIAQLLGDWAQFRGFPSVGMEIILWGHWGLSAVIGMMMAASLSMLLQAVMAFRRHGQIGVSPVRVIVALLLLGILLWYANQPYLFLKSVFPTLSAWLAGATIALAAALLLPKWLPLYTRRRGIL